eukprot:scaffold312264_cov27-Tisochrysis_lutea.AAC.1
MEPGSLFGARLTRAEVQRGMGRQRAGQPMICRASFQGSRASRARRPRPVRLSRYCQVPRGERWLRGRVSYECDRGGASRPAGRALSWSMPRPPPHPTSCWPPLPRGGAAHGHSRR